MSAFYVGYYGRSPDPEGHAYWEDVIANLQANGASLNDALAEVSNRFADADETLAQYPFLDTSAGASVPESEVDQFVTDVFENIYERTPGEAGLDFWSDSITDRLQRGDPIGDIIVDIIGGARGKDAVTIGNKIDVGTEFATTFTAADLASNPDIPGLEEIIDDVDSKDGSVAQARQDISDAAAGEAGASTTAALKPATQDVDLAPM